MTAVLSEDDGVTWKGGLRLDDRDSPSYRQDESPHRRIEPRQVPGRCPCGTTQDTSICPYTCFSRAEHRRQPISQFPIRAELLIVKAGVRRIGSMLLFHGQ